MKSRAQEIGYTNLIQGKGEGLFSRLYEFDPAMVRKVIASYFEVNYPPSLPIDISDLPEIPEDRQIFARDALTGPPFMPYARFLAMMQSTRQT